MMAKMNVGKDVRKIRKGGLCFGSVRRYNLGGVSERGEQQGL